MFAVPGWNLSASLATQIETPNANGNGKKGKKRKRKDTEYQIDEKNIGDVWDRVIEGKGPKSKDQKGGVRNVEEKKGEASEKRNKKRKGKGDKGHKETDGVGEADINGGNTVGISTGEQAEQKPTTASSKPEKKKRKKEKEHKSFISEVTPSDTKVAALPVPTTSLLPEPKGLTPLQKSMRTKLASARFRHLNESLYTKPSSESLDIFKESPEMFEDYHRGFAQQVEVWPENPVDGYVNAILTRGKLRTRDPWKDKKRKEKKGKGPLAPTEADTTKQEESGLKPLPRNMKGHSTIADLGCGTASLSFRLQSSLKPLNLTLHSFDLSKPSGPSGPLVTVADISALPLADGTVDIAIFCLALMGTNWLDFIDEAWRVLRWRGELWVAEIKSRFGRVTRGKGKPPVNSVGSLRKADKKAKGKKKGGDMPEDEGIQGSDDEAELAERVDGVEGKEGTDVSAFVDVLRKHGFVLDALPERANDAIDLSNKMFVKMQFVKGTAPTKGKNVKREDARTGGLKMGIKGKKFAVVEEDGEAGDEADAKVLKPCLYKTR